MVELWKLTDEWAEWADGELRILRIDLVRARSLLKDVRQITRKHNRQLDAQIKGFLELTQNKETP